MPSPENGHALYEAWQTAKEKTDKIMAQIAEIRAAYPGEETEKTIREKMEPLFAEAQRNESLQEVAYNESQKEESHRVETEHDMAA